MEGSMSIDRFPKTRALIEATIREFFARQRPALWFWDITHDA